MKKEIRLLIEGFFDDDIFNPNDINQDIQNIGNQYYDYQVGDIYYKGNSPYAICCGNKSDFTDNNSRFLLCFEDKKYKWCENNIKFHSNKIRVQYINLNNIKDKKTFENLDEKGYENTVFVSMINRLCLSDFPAFEYCIELGNNVYLPALTELEIMGFNSNLLNTKLKKINAIPLRYGCGYLSSNSCSDEFTYGFTMKKENILISLIYKKYPNHVRPFIKID